MEKFRLLLIPFSWLYGLVVSLRNWFYNIGIFKSKQIPGASICIGNITVGGTGKSPLTAYIAKLFEEKKTVILSRGYGRKTQGLFIANATSTASELGDEPMMYWTNFNQQIPVVVSEKRQIGVDWIRENTSNSLILLDDAFQHRAVKSGLNILLMTYDRPIFSDFVFPAGNLREPRAGMKRSDIVVVTKCPSNLSENFKTNFYQKIPLAKEFIFFSEVIYGDLTGLFGEIWEPVDQILLVTGIAQPEPLYRFLAENHKVESLKFPDHHAFTHLDIQQIQQKVATFANQRCVVVTTEKDAVRFAEWKDQILQSGIPFFVQNISLKIDREAHFKDLLKNYVVRANETSC
ncbi:tetraacyldisaccharide 4'-kinase [Fluviicola taffensis]|uniref:Tetraacyldisaccharide 4'-kinase n=1 Tax=Fluviicola taffensis (strain DSM 16823 / NCIMB 13979 / RW262) TaxID=755732 RepID=F2IHP9_FLUTR|nr:tetraacyldisaccharide 4'-kinase [Fluviicola taffensis]AEA44827.1 Tetraacyldisaccharide 4'-kinase [Fluviicola taffensis DSM 16823]